VAGAIPAAAQAGPTFTPEQFGARGDGHTNDTEAFARLSRALTQRGGGTVVLRPRTYLVGRQSQSPGTRGWAFTPSPILEFIGLAEPVRVHGNGAVLRCASGLRFGTFDPATGKATSHEGRFFDQRQRATAYQYMIHAERCAGGVTISDIELDGNIQSQILGGTYGDTGRQLPGSGIFLRDNRGDEIIRNVYSHHHGQDGVILSSPDDASLAARVTRRMDHVRCEFNARQGCSLVGGRNWRISNCRFAHTGRLPFHSAPGAGVDIEAEGKLNRDHQFVDCEFVDNEGCALVADSGDSEGLTFTRCRFIGTTNWSVWPNKPRFSFDKCTFAGSIVRCFSSPDPALATQFRDCLFTDDPVLSPRGRLFREGKTNGSLANLDGEQNILFDRCRFVARNGSVLPWSTAAIYSDCTMRQTTDSMGYPRGTYRGRNIIDSPHVDLVLSHIEGVIVLNGTLLGRAEDIPRPR
jgi:hypothetical protein